MLITCWTKQVMDITSIIFYSPVFQPPVHRLSNLLSTKNRDIFDDRLMMRALKGRAVRGLMVAYSSENFEMLMLQNAEVSSVLRGQFRSKMFGKSIVIFMLVFRNTSEKTLFQKGTVNIGNMSVSVDYNLFAWCCGISIYKNWNKICTDVNTHWDFSYPDRILVGFRDFEAKSRQSRRNRLVEQSGCP